MSDNMENTARHVALIMDGNGRWAKAHGYGRLRGHQEGVNSLRDVVRTAADSGVEYLTVYAFSVENWGRPAQEVQGLMELLATTIVAEAEPLAEQGVRLSFIGEQTELPLDLQQKMLAVSQIVIHNIRLQLVVALNYGAREDIVRAVREIVDQGVSQVTYQTVAAHLSTHDMPEVDLLIRTSGEQRLSNFLLWELSYSEIYFTDILWPDFRGAQFTEALQWFAGRERRFGKL
ncbi:MAG: polyprenyl diphosphate synthase [Mucinivorans sp.]